MNRWKRKMAGLLAAVMLLSSLPAAAFATAADPPALIPLAEDTETPVEAAEPEAETPEDAATLEGTETGASGDAVAVIADAAEKSNLTSVYEIGYRYNETDDWTIIGADKRFTYPGYEIFDDNCCYALRMDSVPDNLNIYFIVWDYQGHSEEYKNEAQNRDYFTLTDENSVLTIDRGEGYTFYVYSSAKEEFYCDSSDGERMRFTTDENWYNANSKSYALVKSDAPYTIQLGRNASRPYENPFPYTLTFGGRDSFSVTPGQGATVGATGNSVIFNRSGASVTADGFTFTVEDPFSGEVTYTTDSSLPTTSEQYADKDNPYRTLGANDAQAKQDPEHYVILTEKSRTVSLGTNDSFPFSMKFRLRGETASADVFTSLKDAEVQSDLQTVTFQKQDASVTVGDVVFTVHDDRAGEVRYAFGKGTTASPYRSVTVGADAKQAEARPYNPASGGTSVSGYALAENRTHTIPLFSNDTFPLQITFSFPRDLVSELSSANLSNATVVESAASRLVIEFSAPDASATIGDYTFKLASPYAGAIRYTIQSDSRSRVVGPDADYAKEAKAVADKNKTTPAYETFTDGAYCIELNDGEYFPCTVIFQKWDEANGWTLPDDTSSVLTEQTFTGADSKVTAFGHEFSIHAEWLEEVKYRLPGQTTVTVGKNPEKAKNNANYELFDAKGNFAIDPNNDIVFPCVVTFTVRNASGSTSETQWTFENTSSKDVEVRGHSFTIRPTWRGEVTYSAPYTDDGGIARVKIGTVGYDKAWAETHSDYDAVDENERTYAIAVPNAVFPIKVTFQLRNSTRQQEIEFKSLNDTHTYQGIRFSVHPTWLDTVKFKLTKTFVKEDGTQATVTRDITVGKNEELAKAAQEAVANVTEETLKNNPLANLPTYVLPKADNSYEIQIPEDDAFYPYGIEFTEYSRIQKVENADKSTSLKEQAVTSGTAGTLDPKAPVKIWFESPTDAKTVGGYKFTAVSNRTDPNKLISAGLWIGAKLNENGQRVSGQYVPFVRYNTYADRNDYWNDVQTDEAYEATLQSLLPLRETRLYANLDGYFPWEIENALLEIKTPGVTGKTRAKEAVAWTEAGAYNEVGSGDYTIVRNLSMMKDIEGEALLDVSGGRYEMVVGQLNQINQTNIPDEDIRYIVDVSTSYPGFYDSFLDMKMSYAEADRAGIRVKGGSYSYRSSYTIPETNQTVRMGEYHFTVNEKWKDDEVFLTMWPDDTTKASFKACLDSGLIPAVYEGIYPTVDLLNAAGSKAVDITDNVWNQELDQQTAKWRYKTKLVADTEEGAPYFTFVWLRDGIAVQVMPFRVLVDIVKDFVWVIDPEGGEEEDNIPTAQISISTPHTSNDLVATDNWAFGAVDPQEEEETGAKVYYYEVPSDPSFKGVGLDRFYVNDFGYTHHIKAGSKNKSGEEITVPLTESETKTYTFSSRRSDIVSYVGEQFYETKEDAEKAVTDGTARKVPLNKVKDTMENRWVYSYAADADFVADEYHSFFSKNDLVNRFIWGGASTRAKYPVTVYAGNKPYKTLDEAKADTNAQDVTKQMENLPGYGAQYSQTIYFTYFNADGEPFECYGVRIGSNVNVNFDRMRLNGDGNFVPSVRRENIEPEEGDENAPPVNQIFTYTMPDESYPTYGLYSVQLHYIRDFKELTRKDEDFSIVVSNTDCSKLTLEQARSNGKDVTEDAIQSPGYTTDYSAGVHFHIYDSAGKLINHTLVITKAYQPPAKSQDTYFSVTGALDKDKVAYEGFAMPYTADAYYIHGYQTIFLMQAKKDETGKLVKDENNRQVYVPIQTGDEFYPTFVSRRANTTIYGTLYEEGKPFDAEIQKSGENKYIFQNSDPAQILNYSAAAENGRHLRNYWVTFLTQQTGKAQLFVNTANDQSHWLTRKDASGGNIIEREVFINDPSGSHDIFFANIGDRRLENLTVTLSDQSAVRLDDYWKLPASGQSVNRYLDAYTTLETKDLNGDDVHYGGIPNIAKIRVFAANQAEAKSVDTDLTISGTYTDDAGAVRTVSQTIHLTGMVGDVRIISPEAGKLRDAVKWVPYANLIGTNNIYGGSTVEFSITSGRLPEGMVLRPNGEIYGTPQEVGTFSFTVTANFTYGGNSSSDSRSYSLEVLTNEVDANVWSENDWNVEGDRQYFGVEYWIPDMVISGTTAEVDTASGPYQSPRSDESGDVESAELSDERRSRPESLPKLEDTKYRDVVFTIKNYTDDADGADFDWFIDLWLNGKRLKGICLEEGQPFTDELRSVYDFYYHRGSLAAVVTGNTISEKANNNGAVNTVAGEFRHNQNTNDRQNTSAGNFRSTGPGKSSSGGGSSSGGSGSGGGSNSGSGISGGGGSSGGSGGSSSGSGGGSSGSGSGSSGGTSGTSVKRYSITLAGARNGSLTSSAKRAAQGAIITITAAPQQGYSLSALTVRTTGGSNVTVSPTNDDNVRTFVMPSSAVTVTATFSPFFRVIAYKDMTFGYLEFVPENDVTPGSRVNITAYPEDGYKLETYRAWDDNGDDVPVTVTGENTATLTMPQSNVEVNAVFVPLTWADTFSDLQETDWFYGDASWALERGLMNGVTATVWAPQDNISTSTIVRTLFRLTMSDRTEEERNVILGEYASDIYAQNRPWLPDSTHGYYREARWAAANNILTENVFTGEEAISRAKFAVILRNYLRFRGIQVEVPTPYEFSDAALIEAQGLALGENLNEAFQILRTADVFRGDRTEAMLPNNNSTRAHLAALLHRLSEYIISVET